LDPEKKNPSEGPERMSLQDNLHMKQGRRLLPFNKKIIIFLFFLLLSILLWFLTALNKDYNTILSLPVRYTRIPRELVLMNKATERLVLDIQARGFTLLRLKMQSKLSPLALDVNSFSLQSVPGESPIVLYLVTDLIIDKLQQQLTSDIRIKSVVPDTLILLLTDKFTKKVPVKLDLDLEFERQYMQVGKLKITPDSVIVSGPDMIIDTFQFVITKHEKLTGLKKNVTVDLDLLPADKLEYSAEEVAVNIPVEKFTEGSVKVPIEVINIPDSLFLRAFPANVEVTYRVGLSDYKKVNEHMFMAVLDYSAKESSIGNKLDVQLVKVPEFVQVTNFSPKSVEYIIDK
jgi:YbbR domain-containing protein